MKITPSPLCWPAGWKRTPANEQKKGPFGAVGVISISAATDRLRRELRLMRVDDEDIIVSTNLALRLDGYPRSGQAQPRDPGAAVYWVDPWTAQPRAMAIDRYEKVEQNIAALAATIESMRAIERHGGAKVIERAFTGFVALPAPGARAWHEVLDIDPLCSVDELREVYRRRRSSAHPTNGGTTEQFDAVNQAYEQGLKVLEGKD